MSKYSGRRGFGRSSGTVTVIETKVHRSSARKAKVAFWVTAFVVGLLSMTIASDRMHPVLALLLGLVVGVAVGALMGRKRKRPPTSMPGESGSGGAAEEELPPEESL